MVTQEAQSIAGTLSQPGKMPCYSYSIPATACHVGQRLAKVDGSVCRGCYALKGNYRFGNVKSAQQRRMESLTDPRWVDAMVTLITNNEGSGYFRWHDAGDLQGIDHFRRIVAVVERTPHIRHWLPTREYAIVREFVQSGGVIPANLTIRFSAYMVDGLPPSAIAARVGCFTSTVVTSGATCPAYTQGGKCLSCRKCWDRSVENVAYPKH